MKSRDIALIALFTALTAVGSIVKIPLGFTPVSVTLQVFFVLLAGLMLGPVRGAISQAAYLIIGLVGLPVFAGGTGGAQAIVSPSGGYLYGFIIAAFVTGLIAKFFKNNQIGIIRVIGAFVASLAGIIVIYFFGAAQLAFVLKIDATKAIMLGVAPFIVVDLIKAVLVSVIYAAVAERGVIPAIES